MKPESAAQTVFATPELANSLFASLTPHDLTQCIRVCKDWLHHAEPVLWRRFCYGGLRHERLSPKTNSGLIRNLPHIRIVELTVRNHAVLQELAHGATQRAQPGDSAVDPSKREVASIHLVSVVTSEGLFTLPKLLELCINCYVYKVDKVDDMDVPDLETILKEAAMARFSQTPTPGKIKALHFRSVSEDSVPLALEFLKSNLLDLESFTVPPIMDDFRPIVDEQFVKENCPNLKHLRCNTAEGGFDNCKYMRAFFRGCSGLQSFASDDFWDNRYNGPSDSYDSRYIMSDLVRYHCDTLRDFELKETRDTRHHDGDAGFDLKDASNGSWVCTELRELWITLGRDSYFEQFYRQIGRLKKLEHLTLDIHRRRIPVLDMWGDEVDDLSRNMDHRLTKDSLDEMAGLKNLKTLRLGAELCKEMRDEKLEFLQDQWPLLREITIMGSMGLKLLAKKRWQRLFDKRPHLRFTVLSDSQMIEAMHHL
ncbi:hypothetical protein BGZ75_009312 [Mortierella antarctica]|nr:hypothetical protein BGZ75_009312 [Mortierella antarctica]